MACHSPSSEVHKQFLNLISLLGLLLMCTLNFWMSVTSQLLSHYFFSCRHFPPQLKEHLSHDILLMCVRCHQMADMRDAALKQQLARETNTPLNVSTQKFKEDPWLVQVRNHAR